MENEQPGRENNQTAPQPGNQTPSLIAAALQRDHPEWVSQIVEALGETTITPELLRKTGVVRTKHPIKVLGDGELSVALTIQAHKFSKSAQEKITKAGGKFEVLQ